jgi:Putative polyhydroxyalkanoic acid system protein (PHA_gran_rgn)
MEPVVITISHSLGKDEVLRRLTPALTRASETFPVLKVEQETWMGDRMDFRVRALGQTVVGNVQVADTSVRLEAALPWLLAKFASVIQNTIESRGRVLLEKK